MSFFIAFLLCRPLLFICDLMMTLSRNKLVVTFINILRIGTLHIYFIVYINFKLMYYIGIFTISILFYFYSINIEMFIEIWKFPKRYIMVCTCILYFKYVENIFQIFNTNTKYHLNLKGFFSRLLGENTSRVVNAL